MTLIDTDFLFVFFLAEMNLRIELAFVSRFLQFVSKAVVDIGERSLFLVGLTSCS